jgi:purine-binding chemotaxis protein CheW
MNTTLPARDEGEQRVGSAGAWPLRVCILRHCGCSYAVALQDVQEVSPLESIAKLPGMPPVIKGLSNVRGSVVAIIDLRCMLGLPQFERQAPQFTVVLRHKEYLVGLLIDGVPEIVTVGAGLFLPAPQRASVASNNIIAGRLQSGDGFTDVLDVRGVIACLESEAADAGSGTRNNVS